MFSHLKKFTVHLGLGLTVCLLLGALLAFLLDNTKVASIVLFTGMGCGLGWGLTWLLIRQNIIHPLSQLAVTGEERVIKDSLALSDALAALAQGNLTAHASKYSSDHAGRFARSR